MYFLSSKCRYWVGNSSLHQGYTTVTRACAYYTFLQSLPSLTGHVTCPFRAWLSTLQCQRHNHCFRSNSCWDLLLHLVIILFLLLQPNTRWSKCMSCLKLLVYVWTTLHSIWPELNHLGSTEQYCESIHGFLSILLSYITPWLNSVVVFSIIFRSLFYFETRVLDCSLQVSNSTFAGIVICCKKVKLCSERTKTSTVMNWLIDY